MEKKAVERAKRVFHTALHMLRDLDAIDQKGVKNISGLLDTELTCTKHKKQTEQIKEQLSKKSFDYPEPQGMQARPLGAQPVEPKPAPKKETKG